MKKTLYRKVMLTLLVVCFVLLIVIALKVGIFSSLGTDAMVETLIAIVNNSYVSSFVCSLLAVYVIYRVQVRYSKKMLKKDYRCNEIIDDIYDGIERYYNVADKLPERATKTIRREDLEKQDSLIFYEFYKNYRADVDIITGELSYRNNDLLLESVQSCFFINLNFELLSIINNIKNRLPNLRNNYPAIKEMFEKSEPADIENRLASYFIDLRFMAIYWKALLDYLEYDPTYITEFIKTYNSKYCFEEDIRQSPEVRSIRAKEVSKTVRKALRQHRIKHFWD